MLQRIQPAAATLDTVPASAAELITNGGFETGDFTGWTLVDGGFTGVAPTPPGKGTFAAFFGPVGQLSTISQTLATTAGDLLDISFFLENHAGSGPNFFSVALDGVELFSFNNFPIALTLDVDIPDVVAGDNSVLTFAFRHDPSFWYLDDVSVLSEPGPVPEPATWAMMLVGMGVVGATMRRRRRIPAFS